MNYTVTWTRHALRQLHNMWTTATDPDAVDAAATRIDKHSQSTPTSRVKVDKMMCESCSIRHSVCYLSPIRMLVSLTLSPQGGLAARLKVTRPPFSLLHLGATAMTHPDSRK